MIKPSFCNDCQVMKSLIKTGSTVETCQDKTYLGIAKIIEITEKLFIPHIKVVIANEFGDKQFALCDLTYSKKGLTINQENRVKSLHTL